MNIFHAKETSWYKKSRWNATQKQKAQIKQQSFRRNKEYSAYQKKTAKAHVSLLYLSSF